MRQIVPLDHDAVVWSEPWRTGAPLVVFLHGFGGNEDDWTGHFDLLPPGAVGAALRGPVPLGERWAWVDFGKQGLAEFSAAARGVHSWLDDVKPGRTVLVGWSQGAAMAAHLARQRPDRFEAIAMAGGFVWERRAHLGFEQRRLPVWFGIGTEDDVIPRQMVASAQRFLTRSADAELREYPGERHWLTREMAVDAVGFAAKHLRGSD